MDIDGDGHLDILSGSYSRMEREMAGLFQVLYGKPDGTFRKAEVLKGTDGKPLIIPLNGQPMTENICTRPFAVDWDGDGHLDLVVGNFSGTFYWFKGEGKGKFRPTPEIIKTGGVPLKIDGHHSDPFVIDWDGDGALDLISGTSNGGVQWAKNRAGKGKPPDLAPFEWLIKPPVRSIKYGELLSEEDLTSPTTMTKPERPSGGSSVTSTSSTNAPRGPDEAKRTKAREEYQKTYNQRTEFMKEERTGFVWLYLQK